MMSGRWARFAAAAGFLCASATVTTSDAADVVRLEKDQPFSGPSLKSGQRTFVYSESSAIFSITYVIVPMSRRIGLFIPSPDAGGVSLARLFTSLKPQPSVLMNGGFLATYTPATPTGLVQSRDLVISDAAMADRVMNGVLCFGSPQQRAPGPVAIEPFTSAERLQALYPDCLQGGPLLLLNGEPATELERLDADPAMKNFAAVAAERSFVARNAKGEAILGHAEKTSLYALRAALMLDEKTGGFGAVGAIALTGRSTAGLLIAVRDRKEPFTAGAVTRILPNVILVSP